MNKSNKSIEYLIVLSWNRMEIEDELPVTEGGDRCPDEVG